MSAWLWLFLIAIALALALGAVLDRFGVFGASTRRSVLRSIWDALTPDFAGFNTERVTTQTIYLLMAAMLVFGVLAAAWAAAAGIMRTAWLFAAQPDGIGEALAGWSCLNSGCPGWLLFGVLVWQVVRAVGGVLLICSAAGLAGALLGFIFGIPRPISAPQAPPAAAGGAAPPPGVDHRQAAKAWELSTNLTQISDWLTKIVVGVSLVEAKNVLAEFQTISATAADWLFGMRHGSPALIAAVIVGGAVFGFLFAYLYTELIISRLIAAVASGLDTTAEAHLTLRLMPLTQGLAPRISRGAGDPQTSVQPKLAEVQAALQYHQIRFEDLVAHPDDTEILNWSRAKAVLNDYRSAAQGYAYLLSRSPAVRQP